MKPFNEINNRPCVYLICEYDNIEQDNIHCKIGVTTGSIENRMKKLQTGNTSKLHCLQYFETDFPFKLEKLLHLHYSPKRVAGEWFVFTDKDIFDFKHICLAKNNILKTAMFEYDID